MSLNAAVCKARPEAAGTDSLKRKGLELERLALFLVLGLGLILRLVHFKFFIPYFYYLDEIRTVEVALRLFQERTLDPRYSLYPGFTIYLNALAMFLYFLVVKAGAVWQSRSLEPIFAAAGQADGYTVNLILVGRAVALAAGTGAIYFVYRMARDMVGARGGLLSALLFALNPMNITYSHLAKVDSLLVLWMALLIWALGRFLETGRGRWSMLAGLAAGLGMATKYAYPYAIAGALIHWLRSSREGLSFFPSLLERRFLLFVLAAALALFGSSPFWFWNLAENIKIAGWIYFSSGFMSFYHISDEVWWHDRYFYTLVIYWPFVLGLPLALLSWPGLALSVVTQRWNGFLLWSFPTIFVYGLSSESGGSITYYSYIFVVPFACVAAVYLLQRLAASPSLVRKALAAFLLALTLAWSALAVNSFRDYFFGPYEQARPWLEKNLPQRAEVAMVSPYFLGPTFGFNRPQNIWPHELSAAWLKERHPDYLLVDTRSLGGFRKFYRRLPVAALFDRILAGEMGYQVIHRFPTRYSFDRYFRALDLEHDTALIVLARRPGP